MLLVSLPKAWTEITEYRSTQESTNRQATFNIGLIGFKECTNNNDVYLSDNLVGRDTALSVHVYCATISTEYGSEVKIAISSNRDAQEMETSQFKNRTVIFWHPGGPAISPVKELKRAGSLLNPKRFSLVAWDGRTASNFLGACGEISLKYGFQRATKLTNLLHQSAKVATECINEATNPGRTKTPWLELTSYGEAEEVELIRKILRLENVHFWASSYGASIAVAFAQKYPKRFGRSVMVSPYLESIDPLARIIAMTNAMKHTEAKWAHQCALSCTTDLKVVAKRGWGKVRESVINSKPKVGSGTQILSGIEFDQAMVSASRYEGSTTELLQMVEAAYLGDGSLLSKVSSTYFYGVDRAIYYSVICPSWKMNQANQNLAYEVSSENSARVIFEEFAPCHFWQSKKDVAVSLKRSLASKILIFTGADDVLSPSELLDTTDWSASIDKCVVRKYAHDLGLSIILKEKIESYFRFGKDAYSLNASFCENT